MCVARSEAAWCRFVLVMQAPDRCARLRLARDCLCLPRRFCALRRDIRIQACFFRHDRCPDKGPPTFWQDRDRQASRARGTEGHVPGLPTAWARPAKMTPMAPSFGKYLSVALSSSSRPNAPSAAHSMLTRRQAEPCGRVACTTECLWRRGDQRQMPGLSLCRHAHRVPMTRRSISKSGIAVRRSKPDLTLTHRR